jgi:hypothetical protein
VIRTYGGGGDGDGGNDVGGVERDVGDDAFGKEEEEDEDEDEDEEEVMVSQDASEIIEGFSRNGIGRREKTTSRFGDVLDMIQGTEVSMRLGSRELATECCGDQGGGGEFDCW